MLLELRRDVRVHGATQLREMSNFRPPASGVF